MQKKWSKRKKIKKALKSAGRKIRGVAQSRIVKRFLPLFGLIAIFKPQGPAHAVTFELGDGLESYGKNGTFFVLGYEGKRRVVRNGVAGVGLGLGISVCSAMGWEQKAIICSQSLGVCAGAATGLYEGDPCNPATIAGKVGSDATSAAFGP